MRDAPQAPNAGPRTVETTRHDAAGSHIAKRPAAPCSLPARVTASTFPCLPYQFYFLDSGSR